MKRTTKNAVRKGQPAVVRPDDPAGCWPTLRSIPSCFAPMLNLIASGKQTIESVMNQAGRAVVELLLQLSATSISGKKSPRRHSGEGRGGCRRWDPSGSWSWESHPKARRRSSSGKAYWTLDPLSGLTDR